MSRTFHLHKTVWLTYASVFQLTNRIHSDRGISRTIQHLWSLAQRRCHHGTKGCAASSQWPEALCVRPQHQTSKGNWRDIGSQTLCSKNASIGRGRGFQSGIDGQRQHLLKLHNAAVWIIRNGREERENKEKVQIIIPKWCEEKREEYMNDSVFSLYCLCFNVLINQWVNWYKTYMYTLCIYRYI